MSKKADSNILPDADLILLLRDNDHIAYTEIFDRYYYLTFVQAYKKLRDRDQAKDLTQELFVDLWVKRRTIPVVNNLIGYFITAVRNRVLNLIEHEKVESKYILSLAESLNTGNIAHTDYLIREREQRMYIERAIQSLPAKMREIFELSRKDNLTHKQIAKTLSLSERTVNTQILNALSRIKTKLGLIIIYIFI